MAAKLTIVLPLSRIWNLHSIAQQIKDAHSPQYDIHVLVICDDKNISRQKIEQKLDGLNLTIIHTGNDITADDAVYQRRERIRDIMNLARQNIRPDDEYVWIIEDDTELTPDILPKLTKSCTGQTQIVSAIQAGRHALKICGIWKAETDPKLKPKNQPDPTIITSQPYRPEGQQYVHGTGLYCLLTKANTFKETPFRTGILGPDFYYGWDTYRKGGKILADWNLPVGHKTPTRLIMPSQDCISIKWIQTPQGLTFNIMKDPT